MIKMSILYNDILYDISEYLVEKDKIMLFSCTKAWLKFGQSNLIIKTPNHLSTIHNNRWKFESLIIKSDDDFNLYKSLSVTKAFDQTRISKYGFNPSISLPWDLLPNLTHLVLSLIDLSEYNKHVTKYDSYGILIISKRITSLTIRCIKHYRHAEYEPTIIHIIASNNIKDIMVDTKNANNRSTTQFECMPIYIERLNELMIEQDENTINDESLIFDLRMPINKITSNHDIMFLGNTKTEELYINGKVKVSYVNTFDHLKKLTSTKICDNLYYPLLKSFTLLTMERPNYETLWKWALNKSNTPLLEDFSIIVK